MVAQAKSQTSDDHLDPRQLEILSAVKSAFLEKGFDGASMQDLARAAGMSAGNFYRYFPSKAAIVEAIVTGELAQLQQEFAAIVAEGDLLAGLRKVLIARLDSDSCAQMPLWDDIEGAAARSPEVAAIVGRMEDSIRGYLLEIFARASGLARPEAERLFSAHALLIVILFKNVAGRCSPAARLGQLHPDERLQLRDLLMRRIEETFDDVRRARPARQDGADTPVSG